MHQILLIDELKRIGKNISRLRRLKNMTQGDLCNLAGTDRSYLSEIENGKMNVTVKSLVVIAMALDCRLEDLLVSSGPMSAPVQPRFSPDIGK